MEQRSKRVMGNRKKGLTPFHIVGTERDRRSGELIEILEF